MSDLIIVGIIIVIVGIGIRSGSKHFKGEGGCCGGGTYKAKSKKLDHVEGKITVSVEGMMCQHCENRVMEAVHSVEGASASVNLKNGIVSVSYDRPVSNEQIREAIEKAGYKVTEIR